MGLTRILSAQSYRDPDFVGGSLVHPRAAGNIFPQKAQRSTSEKNSVPLCLHEILIISPEVGFYRGLAKPRLY
jgi:hypothetical protein